MRSPRTGLVRASAARSRQPRGRAGRSHPAPSPARLIQGVWRARRHKPRLRGPQLRRLRLQGRQGPGHHARLLQAGGPGTSRPHWPDARLQRCAAVPCRHTCERQLAGLPPLRTAPACAVKAPGSPGSACRMEATRRCSWPSSEGLGGKPSRAAPHTRTAAESGDIRTHGAGASRRLSAAQPFRLCCGASRFLPLAGCAPAVPLWPAAGAPTCNFPGPQRRKVRLHRPPRSLHVGGRGGVAKGEGQEGEGKGHDHSHVRVLGHGLLGGRRQGKGAVITAA